MDCFKVDKLKNLVRIFNALPDKIPVDIYSNGELVVSNLQYKEFTSYSYGTLFKQKIDVYKAGTKEKPIIRASIKIPPEQIFTIALIGNEGEESLFVIEDDITQQPSSENAINRIINLAPELDGIDIDFNETPSAANISYRDETLYAYLPPGQYTITVEDSSTENQIVEGKFEFKVNRIYTIYIIGNPQNIEILQSVDGNTYACL